MITFLSASYGGYDDLARPLPQTVEAEWIMVTDDFSNVPHGWQVIEEPRHHAHARLAAKVPKCLPFQYANPKSELVVWLDGSMTVVSETFGAELLGVCDWPTIGQWAHPHRGDLRPEVDLSETMPKYAGQRCREQLWHYQLAGMPPDYGLWATGVMAWRRGDGAEELGGAWLAEQLRWTYQDQLSLPWLYWQRGIKPIEFPYSLMDNPWLVWRAHRRDD